MKLGLSEALPNLVGAKYKSAKASQALAFSPTELAIIRTSAGVPFQLRYCPTLAKKPEPQRDKTPKKKINPFENPDPELFVADLPASSPSHFIVLNKYPIIAEHFILATKINKPQTHVLEQDDLEATYACLKAWQEEGSADGSNRVFAFFNSGEHSGASQPHRHLQLLPVDSMHEGELSAGWDVLIDTILTSAEGRDLDPTTPIQHPNLPFTHYAYPLPPSPTGSHLHTLYTTLLTHAQTAINTLTTVNPSQLPPHPTSSDSVPFSYNLALTTRGMAILPRRSEGHMLRRDDESELGVVQLNGTALAGTLMVKYRELWDELRERPGKLDEVIGAIGIPREGGVEGRL